MGLAIHRVFSEVKKAILFSHDEQKSVDIAVLTKELYLDSSSTSRRVKHASKDGFPKNLESRRGYRARLILGRSIPDDRSVLPTLDELKNKLLDLPESSATVQSLQNDGGGQYDQLHIE